MGKRSKAARRRERREARAAAMVPGHDTARRAASTTDQVMENWRPGLVDPDTSYGVERDLSVARVRDLVRNQSWAASFVDKQTAMVAGQSLRFSAKPLPMAKRLGISIERAEVLGREIESAFQSWANDPLCRADWEQDLTFGGLINLLAREFFAVGEGLAVLRWGASAEQDWPWRTSVQTIDADRLSNPFGKLATPQFRNGIEKDEMGRLALFYHFREAHPGDWSAFGKQHRWEKVPVKTDHGRPIVIHVRAKTRPGESRGVSKILTVARQLKMLERLSDSEIQTAAVNALFAGVIYSNQSDNEISESLGAPHQKTAIMEARRAYYDGADPRLSDGSRIAKLMPGDNFALHTAQRQGTAYDAYQRAFLQNIASGFDMSYEQLASDWSKTNYSSGRMALVETWRHVTDARTIIAEKAAAPILLAVIEEAIDLGKIDVPHDAPGLYENPAGWLAGEWVGPGRGWVDPVKEAQAAAMRIATGLSSHEKEAAEQGADWEANLGQLQSERLAFEQAGFKPPGIAELMGGQSATPQQDESEAHS